MARVAALAAMPLAFATDFYSSFPEHGPVELTLLPQSDDESPACLDGSPYGFYFRPSTANSTKWTTNIQGGGWCYDEALCHARSKTSLGSSKYWPKSAGCSCMNAKEDGEMDDCNCLYMPYGDGASFSGFRPKPWPVSASKSNQDWAFKHGLDKATEFVLTGGSAGGLSTFLHVDRASERLALEAPSCKHVRAAPVVGYFLDHDDFKKDANNYTAFMQYIYHMQNLTFGSDGALTPSCQAAYPDKPHYCFMSPHMQQFIQTPFFMFNSKYDAWQLANELQTEWKTKAEQEAVLQYGEDFLQQFKAIQGEGKHGAMITSCICHGCPWQNFMLEGKSSYQHYAAWYYGKAQGAESTHMDARKPNGDGTMTFPQCLKFPGREDVDKTPLVV